MTITLADLRKSLSECHLTRDDKKVKLLLDVQNDAYYMHRIIECVHACQEGEDVEANTKLGIQLFNIYRTVCRGRIQSERQSTERAGSQDTASNHSENAGG